MTLMFLENSSLKKISNKELLKKYKQISDLEIKAQEHYNVDYIEQYQQLSQFYEDELNRRLDEDEIDEDEIEDLYNILEEEEEDEQSWR